MNSYLCGKKNGRGNTSNLRKTGVTVLEGNLLPFFPQKKEAEKANEVN